MKTAHLLTLKTFIIIGILYCFIPSLLAADYYVSNNGNDTNLGTFTSPLSTIQTALNIASAGDVIYVRGGTYAEKLFWANSGSDGNPITLTNYNAEDVIISGINPTNAAQGAAILISTKSYIRINGLIFRDNIMNFADGVNVTGSGTDIHITNCEFANIGWTNSKTTFPSPSDSAHAIIFIGRTSTSINNIFIGGNYIHDCITGFSESVTIAGNVENFLIEGNTLDNNTNIGIDAAGHFTWTGAPADVNFSRSGIIRDNVVSNYAGPEGLDAAGGIYIDGGSFVTIENNTVFNYKVGFSVGCEVPGNTNTGNIIRNNLAYNCSLSGLFLGSNTTSNVINTQVYNNTFYKCGFGTFDNGQIALQNNTGSDLRNNILYPTNGRYAMVQMGGTTSSSTTLAYNLFWRDNSTITNFLFNITGDTNSVFADPLFINTTSEDFHISSSSPAVNSGDPTYNPGSAVFDIDGQARVQNNQIDIGADESGITNPTESLTVSSINEFDADGSVQTITVTSNIDWTVSENSNWITIDDTSGVGNGSFSITTSENASTNNRSATVTVTGNNISRSISVSQEGAEEIVIPSESCVVGTNLSLNGTIVSFSGDDRDNIAANAIDGNPDNRWSAEVFPQNIVFDLGATYNVNEINLLPFQDRAYQFLVEGSTNSATAGFYTIVDATNNTSGGSTINRTFTSENVRYVRLTVTGASGYNGPWTSIEDFEIICAGDDNRNAKSLLESLNEQIVVYPNPFIDTINIDFLDNTIVPVAKVRVIDASSRVVLTADRDVQENSIELQGSFSTGVYFIQLLDSSDNVIAMKKIISE